MSEEEDEFDVRLEEICSEISDKIGFPTTAMDCFALIYLGFKGLSFGLNTLAENNHINRTLTIVGGMYTAFKEMAHDRKKKEDSTELKDDKIKFN